MPSRPCCYTLNMKSGLWFKITGGVLVASCFILFLTGTGVLINSEGPERLHADDGQDGLRCSYFTGLSGIDREYWYSPNGMTGRTVCPRVLRF